MGKYKYTFSGHQSGIGYDERIRIEDQVLYCSNVDINSDSKTVKLNGKPTGRVSTSGNKIYGFIEGESSSGDTRVFGYGENGKIYRADGSTSHTFGDGLDVRNACHFNGYVYFLRGEVGSAAKIGKILLQDLYDSDWLEFTESLTFTEELPSGTAKSGYPMYDHGYKLIFGVGSTMITLSKTDGDLRYDIFYDGIKHIAAIQGGFIVTCSNGHMRTWVIDSDSTDGGWRYTGKIRGVIQRGHINYIVGGDSPKSTKFAISSGGQTQIVSNRISMDFIDKDKFRLVHNSINQSTEIGDEVFFLNEYADNKVAIWSYGKKHYSKTDAFQEFCSLDSTGNEYSEITSIYIHSSDGDDILYIGMDGYIEKINITTPTYQPTGSVHEKIFSGEIQEKYYTLNEVHLLGENCDADNKIEVHCSTDGGAFEKIATLDYEGTMVEEQMSTGIDFRNILFKVALISNDGLKTPIYRELSIMYEDINNNQ